MDDCLPSDDNGIELTPVLRAVQAGFFGLAALAFSLCLYRICRQEYVGSVRCVVKYGALACLFCFLVEHGCYISLNYGHGAGYEVILTTSDIARELVLVMAHAFIMMAVYMTAQTAATLLQTGSDASGTKHTLLIMWLGEFVVLVGVCVARPLADLWSISVAFDVYTVLEFVGFSFILFTNLYQLNRRVGELRRDLSESCTTLQMEELDTMASSLWRFTLASIVFCSIFTVAIAEQCRRIANDVRDFSRMCYFERVRFFDLTSPVKLVLFFAVVAWTWNRNDRASDRHSSASYSHASEVGSRASLSSSASDLGLVEPLTHGDSGDQTV